MKKLVISVMKFFLGILYAIFKIRKTNKNKVTFLSRQSDKLTLDFKMTQEELLRVKPETQIVTITSRLEGESSGGILKFGIATLKSMYHMANSSVVILDAYWPAVSILNHKKDLTVIQMWHAMGKIKQSGYQTLGKESGRSIDMAHLMKMHEGYTYIIAGGPKWNPFYCLSFNTTEDKLKNYGLPRIDYLLNTKEGNREKILEKYPEFKGKKVVLYAPTFRRNIEIHWEEIVEAVTGEGVVLVVKGHPNQKLELTDSMREKGVYDCPEFSSVDMLSLADYIITDYSAIAVEAAVLNVKTLYFCYDYEEYREKNGMNIDLYSVMPGLVFKDADGLAEVIKTDSYDQEKLDKYIRDYLPSDLGHSTEKIVKLIVENM